VLSGIGQSRSSCSNPYATARESDKAFIGDVLKANAKYDNKQHLARYYTRSQLTLWTYAHNRGQDWRKADLPIHMACWKLAQWELGPSIETNLELFAAIMVDCSARNPYNGSYSIWGDPYRIIKVQSLIARSRSTKKSEDPKQEFRHSIFSKLPMELLEMILICLGVKEIMDIEEALGMLIPDGFWRRYAAWDLVEIYEIAGEDINWRYLCTRLATMMEKDKEFANRNTIVGTLREEIRPVFLLRGH
jgi:hypothetical protein